MEKRMGRPTDNPKIHQIKIRMADDEVYRLEYCANVLNMTKTDIINAGVLSMYDEIKKEERLKAAMLNLTDENVVDSIAKKYGLSESEIKHQRKEGGMFVMTVDEFIQQEQQFCKEFQYEEEDVLEHIESLGGASWIDLAGKLSEGRGCFAKGLHKFEYEGVRVILVMPV